LPVIPVIAYIRSFPFDEAEDDVERMVGSWPH